MLMLILVESKTMHWFIVDRIKGDHEKSAQINGDMDY